MFTEVKVYLTLLLVQNQSLAKFQNLDITQMKEHVRLEYL
jgi:hypothetical protein